MNHLSPHHNKRPHHLSLKRGKAALLMAIMGLSTLQAGHYEDITTEALRPNRSAEGRALPLASRWTVHNWRPDTSYLKPDEPGGYSYPFRLHRLMDEVDDGHYILPFIGNPGGSGAKSMDDYAGIDRLAASGMPIDINYHNLQDDMFQKIENADLYWHTDMSHNPAYIVKNESGQLSSHANAGDTTLHIKHWPANKDMPAHYIFEGDQTVYHISGASKSDADGNAIVNISQPLQQDMVTNQKVFRINNMLDYYAEFDLQTMNTAGRRSVSSKAGDLWQELGQAYPKPPLVLHHDNNENGRVTKIASCTTSYGYELNHGLPTGPLNQWWTYPTAAPIFAQKYTDKTLEFMKGRKQETPWSTGIEKDIAYNGFGWSWEMGRWGGWRKNLVPHEGHDTYQWMARDGSAPEFYVYDWNYSTDYHVGSPHVGSMQAYNMNLVKRAELQNPDYRFEIALWDGGKKQRTRYARQGQLPMVDIGELAVHVDNNETDVLQIQGATPNKRLIQQGQMLSLGNGEAPHNIYHARDDVRSDANGYATLYLDRPLELTETSPEYPMGTNIYKHEYLKRYQGLCRYALWMTRPRIIKEFGWGDYDGVVNREWDMLLKSVDEVWTNPDLKDFWRNGKLVVNPDYEAATGHKHPFYALTDIDKSGKVGPLKELWDHNGQSRDRFYQLTCPLNPDFEDWPQVYNVTKVDENSIIKVWAFAYELGEGDNKRFLLYVQSPLEHRGNVPITIPGYGDVKVSAPREGKFYTFGKGEQGQGAMVQFYKLQSPQSTIPNMNAMTPDHTLITETINFASTKEPWLGLSDDFKDHFAAKVSGYLTIEEAGDHTFYLRSDDGSRLKIAGQTVIDHDGLHGMSEKVGTKHLKAGVHAIEIEYFERTGGAGLSLQYAGPSFAKKLVPNDVLSHSKHLVSPNNPGLIARYYNANSSLSKIPYMDPDHPDVKRIEAQLAFSNTNEPWTGLGQEFKDTFSASYDGFIKIETAGKYTFYLRSDDGTKLQVNNKVVLNHDGRHGNTEKQKTLYLSEGFHPIKVTYFENTGGAALSLSYTGPNIEKMIVPASALWHKAE